MVSKNKVMEDQGIDKQDSYLQSVVNDVNLSSEEETKERDFVMEEIIKDLFTFSKF